MATRKAIVRPGIVWFRGSDLRIYDHEPLLEAATAHGGHVIPLFCFDPRQVGLAAKTRCGQFPKCGIHRTRFLLESIKDLRQALQKLGSDLVVRTGPPEDIIPEIAGIVNAAAVYTQEE
eukprot:gene6366-9292_t